MKNEAKRLVGEVVMILFLVNLNVISHVGLWLPYGHTVLNHYRVWSGVVTRSDSCGSMMAVCCGESR